MPQLEPTYLRYIYDGLVKGSIHPENAAELPEGLIGLYEEAFDEHQPVHKRHQLLERFAIWALLNKAVSVAFVAEILGENEDDIQEFISTYSAWFNSPESGKYQLYHERLKVYLLQKMSEKEIHELHEKLILRLEQAIEEQKADEFEWYGLEFLATHLYLVAIITNDGKKLIDLAYDQTHWDRQIQVSNKFIWSKNLIYGCIEYLNYRQENYLPNLYLMLIALKHKEEQSIILTAELFGKKKFNVAIERLRNISYSGYTAQSRQYTGYILCLLEALRSNNGSFDANNIKSIINLIQDLEEKRFDTSWFIPKSLLLIIYLELKRIGINAVFFLKNYDLDFEEFIINGNLTKSEIIWIIEIFLGSNNTNDFYIKFLISIKSNYSSEIFESIVDYFKSFFSSDKINELVRKSLISENESKIAVSRILSMDLNSEFETSENYETQISQTIECFINHNQLTYVKSHFHEIISCLSKFAYGLNEKVDRNEVLKNIRYILIKKHSYEDAILLMPNEKEQAIISVVKHISYNDSFDKAKNYLELIEKGLKYDDILLDIANYYFEDKRKEDCVNILNLILSRIDENLAFNNRLLFCLTVADLLAKNNLISKSHNLLNKFLSQFILDHNSNEERTKKSTRMIGPKRFYPYYKKLLLFRNDKLFLDFLKDNPTINDEFKKFLIQEESSKHKIKKNNEFTLSDLNSTDIDTLNSISFDLTKEKLIAISGQNAYSSQYATLVNRYLFREDLEYISDLNIQNHLWLLRFELDELEIFLNLWTLYHLFIKNDNEITNDYVDILHLQWAIDIKNKLSN